MRFSYTAEKAGGEMYHGIAEANDRFELYQIVRREGGHLTGLQEESAANRYFTVAYWNERFTTVSEQDKILFVRNLGSMIKAGLPMSRALSVIMRQSKNPKFKNVIAEVGSSVRRGDTLHVALSKFPTIFSKLMIAMVRAGEEGGDLPSALSITAQQMERAADLKKKIKSALIYPAVIVVAIVIIGYLMMTQVVPTLASTFADMGADLPRSTRFVLTLSDILTHYTLLFFAGVAILVGLVITAARSEQGKRVFDLTFIQLPVIGAIVRQVNAARTARTLASLLASGVDVLGSLEITGEVVQNHYFREVIADARRGVSQGEPLSATFIKHERLYPAFVGEMMAVGEETGQMSDMLKHLAEYYEEEVDRATKDLSSIVEPLLMLFIGGAVGFFAVAMITPIYSISQNI